jgi:hypothetical protein
VNGAVYEFSNEDMSMGPNGPQTVFLSQGQFGLNGVATQIGADGTYTDPNGVTISDDNAMGMRMWKLTFNDLVVEASMMGLTVSAPKAPAAKGHYGGVCGTCQDGNPWKRRDGEYMAEPNPDTYAIKEKFGLTWRTTPDTSLFTYATGQSWEGYNPGKEQPESVDHVITDDENDHEADADHLQQACGDKYQQAAEACNNAMGPINSDAAQHLWNDCVFDECTIKDDLKEQILKEDKARNQNVRPVKDDDEDTCDPGDDFDCCHYSDSEESCTTWPPQMNFQCKWVSDADAGEFKCQRGKADDKKNNK